MKAKQFILVFLFVLPIFTLAQDPLLQPDRLWSMVETYCLSQGNTYTSHYLKLGQDTMIEDYTYKSLRYSQDETQLVWYDYGGFIRETAEGKVYYRRDGLPEGLIYDFGASLGDTVIVINHELIGDPLYMVVIIEDSLLLEDGWHRMIILEDNAYPGEETWIEGVGSISGLVKSGLNAFGPACGDFNLLCTSDNAVEVYMNPKFPSCWYVYTRIDNLVEEGNLRLYPNPVQNILNIKGDFLRPGESYFILISDYTGRIVLKKYTSSKEFNMSAYAKGMYFLNIQSEAGTYTGKILKY